MTETVEREPQTYDERRRVASDWVLLPGGQSEARPLRWRTTTQATIGAVVLVNREVGYWKAYIGIAPDTNERFDTLVIANRGTHLGEDVARALIETERLDVSGLEYKGA